MKYIKFGFGAIAVQTINANCCCKNDNNNNNDKKQTEEEIAIDEIVKYFGVQKDYILFTYIYKASERNSDKVDNDINKIVGETQEKYDKYMEKNDKLRVYELSKIICNEDKEIRIALMSETYKINDDEIEQFNDDISYAISNKKNEIYYMDTSNNKTYKKK